MRSLILILCFALPGVAAAYEVVTMEPENSFAIETVEDVSAQRLFVGELDDFPHTFEFFLTDPTLFSAQALAVPDTESGLLPSLILVREVTRGVEEVMRRTASDVEWEPMREPVSALDFIGSPSFETELEPGVYRLEVSNPVNEGQYVLAFGNEPHRAGYFARIGEIMELRRGLGLSGVGVIANRQVYIPLFALLSLGFFGYWYWRRTTSLRNIERSVEGGE